MKFSEIERVTYRGMVGRRDCERFSEVASVELDSLVFRTLLGEDLRETEVAEFPETLRLVSRLEPKMAVEELVVEGADGCRTYRCERRQSTGEPGKDYSNPLLTVFRAAQNCPGAAVAMGHECGELPLVPFRVFVLLPMPYPEIAAALDELGEEKSLGPWVLKTLEWTAENSWLAADLPFPENWLPIFAMQLAGYWRLREAHGSLVAILRASERELDGVLGDMLTEGYPDLLALTADGPERLKAIVEDRECDDFARSTALRAVVKLTDLGVLPRREVTGWLGGLVRRLVEEPEPDSHLQTSIAFVMVEHAMGELTAEWNLLFDQGDLEPMSVQHDDLAEALESGRTPQLAVPMGRVSDGLLYFLKQAFSPREPVRRAAGTGRNDPCPCGSGKKFKKCCGKPG